jgi:hypothetical protein
MATRDSVQYAKVVTNKYLGAAWDAGGRSVPLMFEYTVVAGEVAGDLVNLVQLPANCMVVELDAAREAMASTAVIIGDAGDTDRYMANQSWAAAGAVNSLPFSGQNYKPTADTPVFLTWVTTNPTVGARFSGVIWVVPGV